MTTSIQKQDSQEVEQLLPLGKDCSEFTIGNFIKVVCKKIDAPSNWLDIIDEYTTLTKGNGNNAILDLHKQAIIYRNMYFAIDLLCQVVSLDQTLEGVEDVNNTLRSLTRIRGNGKIFRDELQRHLNVRTSYQKKWEEKEAEIEIMLPKGQESTEQDWIKQLQTLGKYQGYRLDPDNVSTLEYCATLNNFKQDNKPKTTKKYNS